MARETTEEAVSRIANDAVYASRGNVTYSTPNGIANAIRQGMALAYRDAKRFFCVDCAIGAVTTSDRMGNLIHEHGTDFSICRAEVLERRAEEIERGQN